MAKEGIRNVCISFSLSMDLACELERERWRRPAEYRTWPFEILLLDCFTAMFIKSLPVRSGGKREGCWLRIRASVQMD